MDKCRDCNATLKNDETVCWACGAVCQQHIRRSGLGRGFAGLINVAFLVSAAMTVASLFFDATPPFSKCITATIVLLLVKSSSDQMQEKKKGTH
jgi:hypothetical protein